MPMHLGRQTRARLTTSPRLTNVGPDAPEPPHMLAQADHRRAVADRTERRIFERVSADPARPPMRARRSQACMNIHDHRASRMRASAADSAPRPLCAGETLARLWLDLPPLGLRASGRPPGAGRAGLSAEVRPRTIAGWSGPRGRRQQTRGSATWSSWWPRRNSHATPAGVARPRLAVRPPAP